MIIFYLDFIDMNIIFKYIGILFSVDFGYVIVYKKIV